MFRTLLRASLTLVCVAGAAACSGERELFMPDSAEETSADAGAASASSTPLTVPSQSLRPVPSGPPPMMTMPSASPSHLAPTDASASTTAAGPAPSMPPVAPTALQPQPQPSQSAAPATSLLPMPTASSSAPPLPAACEESECCVPADCSGGKTCEASLCVCAAGTRACGEACIPDGQCCDDTECAQGGTCAAGTCTCPEGTHECDAQCVSDFDPATCGGSCEPCMVPSGGTSSCDGSMCGGHCPDAMTLCAGECIANNSPCSGVCPAETNNCNGICTPADSLTACGAACQVCPAPRDGSATCDGEICDFECNNNFKKCNNTCIPNSACCESDECDGEEECVNNTCRCPNNTKQCGEECIDVNACCASNECSSGQVCSDDGRCVDATPPRVTSVWPENGTQGVTSGTPVRLIFSEAMDTEATNNAISIGTRTAADLSFEWSVNNTTVIISAREPIPFSEVPNRQTAPTSYTVKLTDAATDVAGNKVAAFQSTFAMMKKVTHKFYPTLNIQWSDAAEAAGLTPTDCVANSTTRVGSLSDASGARTDTIFEVFDAKALGASGDVVSYPSARFVAAQLAPQGNFYTGGKVVLRRMEYAKPANDILDRPERVVIGNLATSTAAAPELSVRDDLWNLWANGTLDILYRVQASGSAVNTLAQFQCRGFYLEVVYYVP